MVEISKMELKLSLLELFKEFRGTVLESSINLNCFYLNFKSFPDLDMVSSSLQFDLNDNDIEITGEILFTTKRTLGKKALKLLKSFFKEKISEIHVHSKGWGEIHPHFDFFVKKSYLITEMKKIIQFIKNWEKC